MKTLLLAPVLFLAVAASHCDHVALAAPAVNLTGKWELALTTPHGPMSGSLDLHQDGDKLSGTCSTDHFGAISLTGAVEGNKISFAIDVQGMSFTMVGAIEGEKLSGTIEPDTGTWVATRQSAAAVRFVLGSIAAIYPDTLELPLKLESGRAPRS
jgi:hypothetical protein